MAEALSVIWTEEAIMARLAPSAVTCDDCATPLGTSLTTFTADTVLSCVTCGVVWRIVAQDDGLALVFVAAHCCYCGHLTTLGDPCDPWCVEGDAVNRVTLEEVAHASV